MKHLIKSTLMAIVLISTTACSSKPSVPEVTTVQVGKVNRVIYSQVESKPAFITVLAGAAIGGLIGNQFGDGSGKKWATGVGVVAGGYGTEKALSKKYNQVVYEIYIPRSREKIAIVSGDLANNIFKNDAVVVYKKGRDITIDAYGQYSPQKYRLINQKLDDGTLE